jgi:2-oxoglutarate ferredoxin oxidoreductase subunit alpha
MEKSFVWKVGGPAGFGISSIGPVFAGILKKCGYYVHGYLEYPSLIRGGYNSYQMVFSRTPVTAPKKRIDIYLALADVCFEKEQFDTDTVIIGDFSVLKKGGDTKAKIIDIPLKKLVDDIDGKDIMINTAALGASVAALGLSKDVMTEVVRSSYPKKIAEANVNAALQGYSACSCLFDGTDCTPNKDCEEQTVMTGNEAVSIGAIRAGLSFFSTYPMTPASSILHYLAKQARDYHVTVKHAEDEIAGINMAIGAAHAGARAMTGTSGGGFALMNEGFGLAAITEVPIVVALSQRPGPATGMPTWTEQADLQYALHASQGEFLRAVYAPGDTDEAYRFTVDAFNLAEKYQIPVIVLLDKFLSESAFMGKPDPEYGEMDRGLIFEGDAENPDSHFARYKETKDGVCTRSIPGTPGGLFIASSNEHDQTGFVTDAADNRIVQTDRRFAKQPFVAAEMPHPYIIGRQDAELSFVCFGSMKQILLEAMKFDDRFNFIYFPAVHPLDWGNVSELLKGRSLVCFENNKTAQLKALIAENTGIIIEKTFLKYDGRPFFTEEVLEYVQGVL